MPTPSSPSTSTPARPSRVAPRSGTRNSSLVQLRAPTRRAASCPPPSRTSSPPSGLADRGIKTRDNPYYDYPDGSTGDYYAIIRQAREENMTGIIVEHAFVTSASDAAAAARPELRALPRHRRRHRHRPDLRAQQGRLARSRATPGASCADGVAKTGWFSAGGRWYWAGCRRSHGPRLVHHQRAPLLLRRLHRDGDGLEAGRRQVVLPAARRRHGDRLDQGRAAPGTTSAPTASWPPAGSRNATTGTGWEPPARPPWAGRRSAATGTSSTTTHACSPAGS